MRVMEAVRRNGMSIAGESTLASVAELVRPITAEVLFPHRDAPVPVARSD